MKMINRVKRYRIIVQHICISLESLRKQVHVSQLKSQIRAKESDEIRRQYRAQGIDENIKLRHPSIPLFVYDPVCATPHLEGISEGIEFLMCIVTS